MSNARVTLLLIVVLLLCGCTSLRRVPLSPDPSLEPDKLANGGGLKIAGYSSPDGVFHSFHGKVRWTGPQHDSLEFRGRHEGAIPHADPSRDVPDVENVTIRLARSDVTSLIYRAPDGGKTGVLGLGLVASMLLAGTVIIIIAFAGMED